MSSLVIVLWKWGDRYTATHVNKMVNMVRANLARDHTIICVADDPTGIDCETLPIWDPPRKIPRWLNCLHRIKLFDLDLAEYMVSFDLDGIVNGQLDQLFTEDDFKAWGYPKRRRGDITTPYCGSMFMVKAGAHREVWHRLLSDEFYKVSEREWNRGSDQVWMARCLPNAPMWGTEDGVYAYRQHCQHQGMPGDARVVWFHGKPKPWQSCEGWVRDIYDAIPERAVTEPH